MITTAIAARRMIVTHLLFAGTLVFLMCSFPPTAAGADAEAIFSQGNQAYTEGNFDDAVALYTDVMRSAGFSASLLYNMANAYYQKKDVGQAILNYERALFLDPGNPDIETNLYRAKKEFGLKNKPLPHWKTARNTLTLDQWTWLGSMSLAAFSILFFFGCVGQKKPYRPLFTVIGGALVLLFLVSGTATTSRYMDMNQGVITSDDATLRVSPFASASKTTRIKDGELVRIAKTYKDFVLVKPSAGNSGWIAKKEIEPIIPIQDWDKHVPETRNKRKNSLWAHAKNSR